MTSLGTVFQTFLAPNPSESEVSMTMGRATHRGSWQGQRQTVRHSGRAIEEEVMIEHVQVVALLLQMQARNALRKIQQRGLAE